MCVDTPSQITSLINEGVDQLVNSRLAIFIVKSNKKYHQFYKSFMFYGPHSHIMGFIKRLVFFLILKLLELLRQSAPPPPYKIQAINLCGNGVQSRGHSKLRKWTLNEIYTGRTHTLLGPLRMSTITNHGRPLWSQGTGLMT